MDKEPFLFRVLFGLRGGSRRDRFAYIQGHYGLPTEGILKSPIILLNKTLLHSIEGKGENKWIIKLIELPKEEKQFKIIFKAKNLFSAEDIIAIDDIELLNKEEKIKINKNKIKKQIKEEEEENNKNITRIIPYSEINKNQNNSSNYHL
ncbi:MAM domain-containing protein [Meloidogyne graminicola]|uniref:MAM domain-containing protein n=1 Tax=Meloidogyne graminicola TaxID=189291 RepID=A0A8S9ZKM0_9BILA|nr:MAM domain-containing protein [Meloidogyne graminicola]